MLESQANSPATTFEPDRIVFDLDSFKDKNYLTHNFHPYPAKFVPQIPRLVIEALSEKNELVLDPFAGSGTTLVEAACLGRRSLGVDLNPLACLVAKVKTRPLGDQELGDIGAAAEEIRNQALLAQFQPETLDAYEVPEFHNRDHWFESHVQRELAAIRAIVWRQEGLSCREFLEVALSAIIVKVSNQDSDTRWVAVEKELPPGVAFDAILNKIAAMTERVGEYSKQCLVTPDVAQQSATEPLELPDSSVDLVVTSPPYLNSYDYYLYHKLRLFWLGMDHYSVQRAELGSRNRHSDHGEGLETYTEGIRKVLQEVRRVLKPGRFLCIVIGDSILRGELIEMGSVYRELAESVGFSQERRFSYEQRRYTTSFTRGLKRQHKQSHILFFRRT